MGKITVKHYLNKRANSQIVNGESFYPLYIQVIVAGHKAQLKSKIQEYFVEYKGNIEKYFIYKSYSKQIINGYFSEALMLRIENEKIFPLDSLFKDELNIISRIIESLEPNTNDDFSLVNISGLYEVYLKDVNTILEEAIKDYYLKELKGIFIRSTRDRAQKKIFKITNFFIHYMNWNTSFWDYYETTYEVLPSEIKMIENYLSDELKIKIKAGLAFKSKSNTLSRNLDKSVKGLFPLVNYLDWQSEGKDYLLNEFLKLFGDQKAMEYIESLDKILVSEIHKGDK